MKYPSACMEIPSGTHIAIISGMLTANPMENRSNLSCRSASRAAFSASSLTCPAMPRYWYPSSSIARFMSSTEARDGL